MIAETQRAQQLANLETESHHISSVCNNGDTTFHPSVLGTSQVALEHSHIENGNAEIISGGNHQDAARPGGKGKKIQFKDAVLSR